MKLSPAIFPLGDAAITIDLGNLIDEELNRQALAMQEKLAALHLPGIKDIIVAYSSVSVFYDPGLVMTNDDPTCPGGAFGCMKKRLEAVWQEICSPDFPKSIPGSPLPGPREHTGSQRFFDPESPSCFHEPANAEAVSGPTALSPSSAADAGVNIIRLPVCYDPEYGPDLDLLARKKGLTRQDIIRLHTSNAYRVYMIGFLPGFPYLGKVDPALETPRKERPVPVAAGGVGIAGNQTGIYPLHSPGGWQIIGRTPLRLFNPHAQVPVSMKVGDWVQFFSITQQEFRDLAVRQT